MAQDLIITNGDSAASLMAQVKLAGSILAWRDVLHEGPVPLTRTLAELSQGRADYLTKRGWSAGRDLREVFRERDHVLARAGAFDRITLLFEHDLYDQLQLLQIIDALSQDATLRGRVRLGQSDQFLTRLTLKQMTGVFETAEPVTASQVMLARRAWSAFRQQTPETWAALLDEDTSALPFLRGTIVRMLEELPDVRSGLAKSEYLALDQIREGVEKPGRLFAAVNQAESAAFMGDWSFFAMLDGLADCVSPLIDGLADGPFKPGMTPKDPYFESRLRLTVVGSEVLAGVDDHIRHNGIERWWGGTHLTRQAAWRWDKIARQLVAPAN